MAVKKHSAAYMEKVKAAMAADTENLIVIADNTEYWLDQFPMALARAMEKIGLMAERYAKKLCPFDTGRLRNSITYAVDGGEEAVYIGTNVEYAPYVELGNHRHDPQPFLVPAARDHVDQYSKILKSELGK